MIDSNIKFFQRCYDVFLTQKGATNSPTNCVRGRSGLFLKKDLPRCRGVKRVKQRKKRILKYCWHDPRDRLMIYEDIREQITPAPEMDYLASAIFSSRHSE